MLSNSSKHILVGLPLTIIFIVNLLSNLIQRAEARSQITPKCARLSGKFVKVENLSKFGTWVWI